MTRSAVSPHAKRQGRAARRQHMAYDVRDGVGLPGTRRALNDETVRLLQAADDFNLFVIEWLGKRTDRHDPDRPERRHHLVSNMIGCAQAVPERLECVIDTVGRTQDQRPCLRPRS